MGGGPEDVTVHTKFKKKIFMQNALRANWWVPKMIIFGIMKFVSKHLYKRLWIPNVQIMDQRTVGRPKLTIGTHCK